MITTRSLINPTLKSRVRGIGSGKSFWLGLPLRIPLGELTTLLRPLSWMGRA